ncbi:MAG: acyl carrier protein [Acidobacteriota bacterium]|nr:acyl carrier protein [Acidobacteriota bacterium]
MDPLKRRLAHCFQTVFPDLREDQIPHANQENLALWDSVAAITLVNVIEEEFAIEMDLDSLAELNSFDRVYEHLRKEVPAAS